MAVFDVSRPAIESMGRRWRISFTSSSLSGIQAAVADGMGISLLPFYTATRPLSDGTLVRLLPNCRARERNVYALYPSRHFLDAKVRTWVDFLKIELPKLFAEHEAVMEDSRHWA